jgi:hypothetical protein
LPDAAKYRSREGPYRSNGAARLISVNPRCSQRVTMKSPALASGAAAQRNSKGNWRCTMTTADRPLELEQVACEICLKEIPKSEATVPEATDYVVYFCGLDCYERWKAKQRERGDQAAQP